MKESPKNRGFFLMERPWGTAPNPALFLSEKEGQRTLQSPRIRAVEDKV